MKDLTYTRCLVFSRSLIKKRLFDILHNLLPHRYLGKLTALRKLPPCLIVRQDDVAFFLFVAAFEYLEHSLSYTFWFTTKPCDGDNAKVHHLCNLGLGGSAVSMENQLFNCMNVPILPH